MEFSSRKLGTGAFILPLRLPRFAGLKLTGREVEGSQLLEDHIHHAVDLTLAEYEDTHAQRDRFVVAPGHKDDQLEHVVERNERYLVVDKFGEAERITEAEERREGIEYAGEEATERPYATSAALADAGLKRPIRARGVRPPRRPRCIVVRKGAAEPQETYALCVVSPAAQMAKWAVWS